MQSVKPRNAGHREEQHQTIFALAISFHLIYSEEKDVITIWAVAHGSRRPEYWKPRF